MNEVPSFEIGDNHTLMIDFENQEIAIIEANDEEDDGNDVVILSMPVLAGILELLQSYLNADGKLIRKEGLYVQ